MATRSLTEQIDLPVPPMAVFNLLLTPKGIRGRSGEISAIVMDMEGQWVLAWGLRESDPDYVAGAQIKSFQAPGRIVLAYDYCRARAGVLPFGNAMTAEFAITQTSTGSRLRVTQSGFPTTPDANAALEACTQGWRAALQGILVALPPPLPSQPKR